MEESFENYFENSLQYFCGNTAVLGGSTRVLPWKYRSTPAEVLAKLVVGRKEIAVGSAFKISCLG